MSNAIHWRHTHPAVTCPDSFRLLATRETGKYRGATACKRCRDWLEKSEHIPGFTEANITPLERACGVTLAQVETAAPRTLFRDDLAIFPVGTAPALVGAILRAVGRVGYDFSHFAGDMPVYKATARV